MADFRSRRPPLDEQRRYRRAHPNVVPSSPYLLASKALDAVCQCCVPSCTTEGWRSLLPRGWGEFPSGKLGHEFHFLDGNAHVSFRQYADSKGNDASSIASRYHQYAFHTPSTALESIASVDAIVHLIAVVWCIRKIKRWIISKCTHLGRRLIDHQSTTQRSQQSREEKTKREERIRRFGEYSYELWHFATMTLVGLYAFCYGGAWQWMFQPSEDSDGNCQQLLLGYRFDSKQVWKGHPNQEIQPWLARYYLVQFSLNLELLVSLLRSSICIDVQRIRSAALPRLRWSSTAKSDFTEMCIHHIITNLLIIGSSLYNLQRIGFVIFLLHDIGEVPIGFAKLAHYLQWDATSVVLFVATLLAWVATRLTLFPYVLYHSIIGETWEHLVVRGSMDPALYRAFSWPCMGLLGGLVLLHVFWFLVMVRIGWVVATTGEKHDYTEHPEGEPQPEKRRIVQEKNETAE